MPESCTWEDCAEPATVTYVTVITGDERLFCDEHAIQHEAIKAGVDPAMLRSAYRRLSERS